MESVPDMEKAPNFPEDLSRQVFENDLIREIIIDHFLHCNDQIYRRDVPIARNINSSWLQSTTNVLRKHRQPLFILELNSKNSNDDSPYVRETGAKLLQNVMTCFTSPSAQYTYSLKVVSNYFTPANSRELAAFLANFGDTIVKLDITFPQNEILFPETGVSSFPILQSLSIKTCNHQVELPSENVTGYNLTKASFIQTLINATTELKQLSLNGRETPALTLHREDFRIPSAITKFHLDCPINNTDLTRFLNNDFPNLKSLSLYATDTPFEEQTIYCILDKYRDQITSLSLTGKHYRNRVTTTTLFRLPVMSTLEHLMVASKCWELHQDAEAGNLQEFLPSLKELKMYEMRSSMFEKWTKNSNYPLVQNVGVSLISSIGPQPFDVPISLCSQRMKALHLAYPNVVILTIYIHGQELSGLNYIFLEMRSLERLTISFKGSHQIGSYVHWDSVLVGAPLEVLRSLKHNQSCWPMFIPNDDNRLPSIRKLTKLNTLALLQNPEMPFDKHTFISEMSFHFAFLRMENLKLLIFSGLFMPTEEVRMLWTNQKGKSIRGLPKKRQTCV